MDKRKPKIIISVINDLVTDQRVHKVAQTLHNEGYNVFLIGRLLRTNLALNVRDYQTKRMVLFFTKGPFFYAEFNIRLFFFLLFHKFDILLSNDLDTLLGNYLASKLKRKALVYDSHEIFTEVPELINRPLQRNIWRIIERNIIPKLKHSYTVNQSVSDYYFEKYEIRMKVVRNVPKKSDLTYEFNESNFQDRVKIIVYQGALNVGRGLELMIETMQFLENMQLMIIGDGDIKHRLIELINKLSLNEKVKMLGKIPFSELKTFTKQADLGISLEENLGLNYYLALPNKIFDYIHAGVPVLVSDLPEIAAIIKKYKIGVVTNTRIPIELATLIQSFFKDIINYKKCKQKTILAQKELCWENEEKTIINIFSATLNS